MPDKHYAYQTLISIGGALIDVFIALILVASILIVMASAIGLHSIDEIQNFMISLLVIIATIIGILFFGAIIFWIIRKDDMLILPFEVMSAENKFSGRAISESLIAELNRIEKINKIKLEKPELRRLPLLDEEVVGEVLDQILETIKDVTIKTSEGIPDVGMINLGTTTVNIGPFSTFLKGHVLNRKPIGVISGSFQRYGSVICLVAHIEYKDKIHLCEINRKIVSDQEIHELIKDLAFEIAHDLTIHTSKSIVAKSWEGLKYFTESLYSYDRYTKTNRIEDLDRSKRCCLEAIKAERDYELLFGIAYYLGIAYYKIEMYDEALKMFEQAISISQGQKKHIASAYSALGVTHRYIFNCKEAYEASTKALEYCKDSASAYAVQGTIYLDLGCYVKNYYEEAIKVLSKATMLDKNMPAPYYYLGLVYYRKGNLEEAIKQLEEAIRVGENRFDAPRITLASCYQKLKKEKESEAERQILEAKFESERQKILETIYNENSYSRACFSAICGNYRDAIGYLSKALENEITCPIEACCDPDFESIKSKPEFKDILKKYSTNDIKILKKVWAFIEAYGDDNDKSQFKYHWEKSSTSQRKGTEKNYAKSSKLYKLLIRIWN
jgi:tetratricopeptide (TPR) repeat protein